MRLLKITLFYITFKPLCISSALNGVLTAREMEMTSNTNLSTENLASTTSCIETTIPDVFSIGKCLGQQRDFCVEETKVSRAVVLVGCTLLGAFADLDTVSAFMLIRDIYVALAERRFHNAGKMVDFYLYTKKYSGNIGDQVCGGEITIALPNTWAKCINENLAGCAPGDTVKESTIQSIVQFEECIATDVFDSVSQDAIEDLFCDFLKKVQVTSAAGLKAKGLLMLVFKDKCF
ncbi:uncharacterized protein LOC142591190 [Dermacentor variabilis]|uniref:uncharacterized protein LOC142591190 n=1 Tax=Dermacentor variabilis TaxID=34621 RepID=UPI003F5C6F73